MVRVDHCRPADAAERLRKEAEQLMASARFQSCGGRCQARCGASTVLNLRAFIRREVKRNGDGDDRDDHDNYRWSSSTANRLRTSRPSDDLQRRPNIVLWITDDQDRTSDKLESVQESQVAGGGGGSGATVFDAMSVHMPAFDYLWRDAVEFTNAHTSSPVCTPSRFTFLTGQYASRFADSPDGSTTTTSGASSSRAVFKSRTQATPGFNVIVNPERQQTIAHHLRLAGWRSGFVGKFHVGPDLASDGQLASNKSLSSIHFTGRVPVHHPSGRVDQAAWIRSLGFDEAHAIVWDNNYEVGVG
jgi:hypothetical protein